MGNFIHYLSTFLAGLVVGFVSAWRLALLSVAVIPGIAFAGGLYAYTLTGLTSKSRESYANAGIIAEQVILFSFYHLICRQIEWFLEISNCYRVAFWFYLKLCSAVSQILFIFSLVASVLYPIL